MVGTLFAPRISYCQCVFFSGDAINFQSKYFCVYMQRCFFSMIFCFIINGAIGGLIIGIYSVKILFQFFYATADLASRLNGFNILLNLATTILTKSSQEIYVYHQRCSLMLACIAQNLPWTFDDKLWNANMILHLALSQELIIRNCTINLQASVV